MIGHRDRQGGGHRRRWAGGRNLVNDIYTSPDGARTIERSYRRFLDRWPVPNEQRHVPTREGETFVVACGPEDAPPLLLLHGASSNTAMWTADVPAWSQHFRVYAVDVIGDAGLSAPSRPDLASEAHALWLDDVLDALGVERTSFVGISLGGFLAVDYATRRPHRVDRLALLCPVGFARLKAGAAVAALPLMQFGRRGRLAGLRLMLGDLSTSMLNDQEYLDFMVLVSRHLRPRLGAPVFDDATLGRLDRPVLAIVGGRDRMVDSGAIRRRLERIVSDATVRLVPGAGHALPAQTLPVLEFLHTPDATGPRG
ncbi:MAG: alpha/beta hydrolase [Actinomycetales bacterium]|nr:alpha/beta hydrolase [Actinomycetales bacterium]